MDINDIFSIYEKITVARGYIHALSERRKKLYNADKSLLEGDVFRLDINNIKVIPDGKIRIDINNARFECFFHAANSKKLFVILDGARTGGGVVRPIPIYSRWSWYPFVDVNWLCIEDPMYYKYDNLLLGWFWGDEANNYRGYVALIAAKIATYLGIKKDDVVFYGSSGGGTAAIHSAALYGGGVAVSINGQINFEYCHQDIVNFINITGIDIHKPDKENRNDLCRVMQSKTDTKYLIIENCLSRWDYDDHLLYLCTKTGIHPTLGIEQHNNIVTWLYEAPGKKPHVAFDDRNIFFAIKFLAELIKNGEDINKYKPLYQLFGEFWYERYELSK